MPKEDERNKNSTINNDSHKKGWNSGITQAHVEPPLITLTKVKYDGKSDKYFEKLKLRRVTTSSTSDLYNFILSLFKNGVPDKFLFFRSNLNIIIAESGTMDTGAKIQ